MKRSWLLGLILLALVLTAVLIQKIALTPPSPVRPHPVEYDYYQIIDQTTGETVTYISVPVSPGDEYVTADNRRFVVVTVRGNKAFARVAGSVNSKFGPPLPTPKVINNGRSQPLVTTKPLRH